MVALSNRIFAFFETSLFLTVCFDYPWTVNSFSRLKKLSFNKFPKEHALWLQEFSQEHCSVDCSFLNIFQLDFRRPRVKNDTKDVEI